MKMLKSPLIAASVTLSLTACFEDNTTNAVPNGEAPISAESPTGNELPGDELGGNDIFSSSSAITGNPPNPNPGNGNHLFTTVNGKQDTAKAAIYAKDDLNIKGASYIYR